jgi:translation initiation factor 2B subunit (eIF-2B alpha/beta/delta family)
MSHFAVIKSYIEKLERLMRTENEDLIKSHLIKIESLEAEKFDNIFKNIYKKLPLVNSILTISKSSTLLNVFKLWYNRKRSLQITILESRPALEGRIMAKELLKEGMKVEIITDAMAGMLISKTDAVIIGADAILKNGNVINKSGSMSLALLCKYYKKPFYVLTAKSKNTNKIRFDTIEDSSEMVWKYKHPKLKTSNIPFEEIDRKFISGIISE